MSGLINKCKVRYCHEARSCGRFEIPGRRIEPCWEATRAPTQGRDGRSRPLCLLLNQQFWPKALNPGGMEAGPPCSSTTPFRIAKLPCRSVAVRYHDVEEPAWAIAEP